MCFSVRVSPVRWLGGIDLLVLNAGRGCLMSLEDARKQPDIYEQIMKGNQRVHLHFSLKDA